MSTCDTKLALAAVALLLGLSGARSAHASSSYPGILIDKVGVECVPACTVCHRDQTGGPGTATKVFAESLIDAGLVGEDDGSLETAIAALATSGADSDADGVSDIAELKDGRDPNISGDASICGPQYGCGARVARDLPRREAPFAALALLFALALRRGFSRSKRR